MALNCPDCAMVAGPLNELNSPVSRRGGGALCAIATDHSDPAPNAHPSPQWRQDRCWDGDGFFLGALWRRSLTELAALWPGNVVDDGLAPPSLRTIIDELDIAYWWPTECS